MKLWSWLKERLRPPSPESRWTVCLGDGAIEVTPPGETKQRLALTDLSGVTVETNDSGPWGADVWWLLFGDDDKLACAFPLGATGDQAVIDHLMALPTFDHAAMTDAMRSTDNALFPLWRRS